jgi:uncharacterized protein YbcV (DUF1398 family)
MFSTAEIQAAHSKVKSGADFPAYIRAIKALGVTHYEAYVIDGHIDYHGGSDFTATVPAKYATVEVADVVDSQLFKSELLAHQQGKTDYPTFIKMCADCGIEKWIVAMDKMSCIYYDKAGKEILAEQIPQ